MTPTKARTAAIRKPKDRFDVGLLRIDFLGEAMVSAHDLRIYRAVQHAEAEHLTEGMQYRPLEHAKSARGPNAT